MTFDKHDEGAREGTRSEVQQSFAALRALEENGVEVTGSESATELSIMQSAVDAFRRAAEALAGLDPSSVLTSPDNQCRHLVPPRAADETPRQYVERVNRVTKRFRSLAQSPGRDTPR
jgi:hypothetical protein